MKKMMLLTAGVLALHVCTSLSQGPFQIQLNGQAIDIQIIDDNGHMISDRHYRTDDYGTPFPEQTNVKCSSLLHNYCHPLSSSLHSPSSILNYYSSSSSASSSSSSLSSPYSAFSNNYHSEIQLIDMKKINLLSNQLLHRYASYAIPDSELQELQFPKLWSQYLYPRYRSSSSSASTIVYKDEEEQQKQQKEALKKTSNSNSNNNDNHNNNNDKNNNNNINKKSSTILPMAPRKSLPNQQRVMNVLQFPLHMQQQLQQQQQKLQQQQQQKDTSTTTQSNRRSSTTHLHSNINRVSSGAESSWQEHSLFDTGFRKNSIIDRSKTSDEPENTHEHSHSSSSSPHSTNKEDRQKIEETITTFEITGDLGSVVEQVTNLLENQNINLDKLKESLRKIYDEVEESDERKSTREEREEEEGEEEEAEPEDEGISRRRNYKKDETEVNKDDVSVEVILDELTLRDVEDIINQLIQSQNTRSGPNDEQEYVMPDHDGTEGEETEEEASSHP